MSARGYALHSVCSNFPYFLSDSKPVPIQPSLTNQSRTVVHDIPVDVIPRRLWDEYEEPEMPQFDVSIYMPPLKLLRNVIERMKTLANFVVSFHHSRK